jgi:hypothetical protein
MPATPPIVYEVQDSGGSGAGDADQRPTFTDEQLDRREQLARMLSKDGWLSAAHFAAYSHQIDALRLKPWQDFV